MAKATKVQPDYELTLTLSKAEAEVLRFVMGSICGGSKPRLLCDDIRLALEAAGVQRRVDFRTADRLDSIYFED